MSAAFADASICQHIDVIRQPDRGKAMTDEEDHAPLDPRPQVLEHLVFGPDIQPTGGLIENEQLGLPQMTINSLINPSLYFWAFLPKPK
jgi:hypothetical protein